MRSTFRTAAAAITWAAVLAGAFGCSAANRSQRAADGPAVASQEAAPSPTTSNEAPGSGQVTQAAFNEDDDGARVVVSADAPLVYTAYEPRPDLLVVEMPSVRVIVHHAPHKAMRTLAGTTTQRR